MKGFVEDVMYVYQGKIPMPVGDAKYQWSCICRLILPHGQTNHQEPQLTLSKASLKINYPQRMAVSSPWIV